DRMNAQAGGFRWRTALKIAWRDARSSPAKFLFVILAVAVGVGALTGVRSFSRAFHDLLLRQARTFMAGGIFVRVFCLPDSAHGGLLNSGSAAVSDDLLIRLKARVGDQVRLGGQEFRIAALLVSEPDRITGSLNVGPRVMISREGLDRTGLIGVGSRAAQRFLFRLPPGGPDVQQVRNILKR